MKTFTITYLWYGETLTDELEANSYSHCEALASKLYPRVLKVRLV